MKHCEHFRLHVNDTFLICLLRCDVAYPTKIRSFPLSSTYQVDRYLDCATVEFDVYPDGRLYDSYLR